MRRTSDVVDVAINDVMLRESDNVSPALRCWGIEKEMKSTCEKRTKVELVFCGEAVEVG